MIDDRRRLPAIAAVTLSLLLSACGSATGSAGTASDAVPPPSAPAAATEPAASMDPAMPHESMPAVESAAPSTAAVTIDAAWAQAELTDVATGQSFRIGDLAGKVVIVESMAIWCPNCLRQQVTVHRALDELDPDRVAYVVLDVDPNETADSLARYREQNGFSGTYAIAGREVARALAAEFGDQVLNPPSTPIIVIGTDGRSTLTDFGQKTADELVALAREHGA